MQIRFSLRRGKQKIATVLTSCFRPFATLSCPLIGAKLLRLNLQFVVLTLVEVMLGSTVCMADPEQSWSPLEGRIESKVRKTTTSAKPSLNERIPPYMVLQGKMEHSDFLPPCPPNFKIGERFMEESSSVNAAEDGWYWIPHWLAGFSRRDRQITIKGRSKITTEMHAESTEPCGWQMDKCGEIWDYHHVPYVERQDLGQFVDYKTIIRTEPIKLSDAECIFRSWSRTVRLTKTSQRIEKVYQQDELQTVKPESGGKYRVIGSIKMFDASGCPIVLNGKDVEEKYIADDFIVKPFTPVNHYGGKDMVENFKSFLLAHGLANLIPDK
jgi:hypothetical protein